MPYCETAPAPRPRADHPLSRPDRTRVMGVLNATPDSFYAPSRVSAIDSLLAQAGRFLNEGADALDLGGESTRPGAAPVPVEEEGRRILPALRALREAYPGATISIDTRNARTAHDALREGASMINDISALRHDRDMADVLAGARVPVILMHMQGTPETMQQAPRYADVVSDIRSFFEERLAFAQRRGIAEARIHLDPGIGFGKTVEHNLEILRRLREFKSLGRPLWVGVSRKAFIGKILGSEREPLLPEERLEGTLAAQLWAVQHGADGLRVHDVAAAVRSLLLWERLSIC